MTKNRKISQLWTKFNIRNILWTQSLDSHTTLFHVGNIYITQAKKHIDLIQCGGICFHKSGIVPWKEIFVKNILLECQMSKKGPQSVKQAYITVGEVMTLEEIESETPAVKKTLMS